MANIPAQSVVIADLNAALGLFSVGVAAPFFRPGVAAVLDNAGVADTDINLAANGGADGWVTLASWDARLTKGRQIEIHDGNTPAAPVIVTDTNPGLNKVRLKVITNDTTLFDSMAAFTTAQTAHVTITPSEKVVVTAVDLVNGVVQLRKALDKTASYSDLTGYTAANTATLVVAAQKAGPAESLRLIAAGRCDGGNFGVTDAVFAGFGMSLTHTAEGVYTFALDEDVYESHCVVIVTPQAVGAAYADLDDTYAGDLVVSTVSALTPTAADMAFSVAVYVVE